MYEEMLAFVLDAVRALNTLSASSEHMDLGSHIPVLYQGEQVGELVDEIGGAWSFRETSATEVKPYGV